MRLQACAASGREPRRQRGANGNLVMLLQQPLSFVALLGVIALMGMIICDSVILIDPIEQN